MGMFQKLSDNVTEIGILTVVIVLISLLLLNMKTSDNVCVGNAAFPYYNATADVCCVASGNCAGVNQTAINAAGTSINTSVTSLGTPITFVQIIILVVVFAAIIGVLVSKFGNKGKGGDF